ncbi:MerR family transcriptional regulator [Dactylosporangium fulvum]|uniref:MerR family transcriptional regulator n=1 Tax=Dactylosporangium fulvum TaxID=53359 RepID=A0ABY5VYR4_9ACTN|nr:MerR family transcriptional regulator [Dactylosporangium fulvum]UWP82407.1 MerR family transcriptional regulator [Dactylosporangium fulvum]
MTVGDEELLSIGDLAKRSGLPVKLIRRWSDCGLLSPADRTRAGYRRYDARAVAQLELARTLRELGLGLAAIREVMGSERGLSEVAATHADALDAQIRRLRLQRAVLRWVAAHHSTAEELSVVSNLTRLSAAERAAMIDRFIAETVKGLDVPDYRDRLRAAAPELPDDPTAEQVDAWIELTDLIQDPKLRTAMNRVARYADEHAPGSHEAAETAAVERVTEMWTQTVFRALADDISADSPDAERIVAEIVRVWLPTQTGIGDDCREARRRLLEQLEIAADARAERYWQLVCIINGMPAPPSSAAAGRWLVAALRANPQPASKPMNTQASVAARQRALNATPSHQRRRYRVVFTANWKRHSVPPRTDGAFVGSEGQRYSPWTHFKRGRSSTD